ncbi:MAG: ATP synthase subunit delta [Elusimicrobia bacterium]|nr:ATP synthase subunit delta [Elusimicrobiota bacterium]
MRNVTVARRYAKAVYQVAVETSELEDVLQALGNLSQAYGSSADFKRLLLNPLVKVELKQRLIRAVTSNKLTLRFTELLAERKRLDLLPVIHEQLLGLGDAEKGLHRALIKTAIPLNPAQKKEVEASLASRLGGKVLGQFEVTKDLIGGVWVKMGDKVLDASIKGRIENFRQALIHSAN